MRGNGWLNNFIIVLIGPSGCDKTTVLRMIAEYCMTIKLSDIKK